MNDAKKILVLGGPGSGKSVLSFNLSEKMNIPVYYLDQIHIRHDIEKEGKKDRNNNILKILENSSWIMDGNYRSTLDERIKQCDVILFLDYPTYKLLIGVLSRSIKQYFKIEKGILNSRKLFDFNVLRLAYTWRKQRRNDIIDMLNKVDTKKYIFKSRRKLNVWFKQEFREKMRCL